jgi:hypothetical protein
VATRGVGEEALLKGMCMDLGRDIEHNLCLDLVWRVRPTLLGTPTLQLNIGAL